MNNNKCFTPHRKETSNQTLNKVNINWSQLNKIKDVKIISSMYVWIFIVPIAAKILSLTNDIANITVFNYTFSVNLGLPFSWRLFYFSAIFFALATLTYQIRCPKFIKDYSTFTAFYSEGKPEWHMRRYAEDIDIDYEEFKNDLEVSMVDHDGYIHEGKEYFQSVFWHLHWLADNERKKSLLLCLASYAIGFALITIVFIQNLSWVINNILSTM